MKRIDNTKMRKSFSTILIAASTLFMTACSSPDDDKIVENTTVEYTFPGEWEPHEGTWLIWPHDYGIIIPEYVDMIDDIWVTMTKALHTGEKVHIVAYNDDERTHITTLLEEAEVDMSQVTFLLAETDQFWARDCGPMFAIDSEGKPAILDWGYNGYGRMDKFGVDVPEDWRWELPEFVREEYLENYTKDDVLAQSIASAMDVRNVNLNGFILEGGAIESDGCGTIITTESCILNENRNPGITRTEAEVYFKKYLGATNVIWLAGSPNEDITDGHIDGLVRFADANTIVTMTKDDYHETYDYTPRGDYNKVINAKNAAGKKYKIVTLPITAEDVEWLGWRANYLNYYAGNDVVLVPVYEDVMDAEALRILGELYPDKEIIPINGEILAVIGGGIHCVTQQQPVFNK
ncbi:MAG: agmatine deiminase family protein [Bacteroidaceae bacterium]|nr:agmatine deiminase family protein [Bacteroidaceae bacterium]